MEKRALLMIHMPNNNKQYSSAILSVDSKHNTLTLDELNPTTGHNKLINVKTFYVVAQLAGAQVRFKANLNEVLYDKNIASYIINFPKQLLYAQRRHAFRVGIGAEPAIPVAIFFENKPPYEGNLTNISSSGFGAIVENDVVFNEGDLCFCKIELPEGGFVSSEIKLRFTKRDKLHNSWQVGAQFVNLTGPQHSVLDRFVMTIQREIIKRKRNSK